MIVLHLSKDINEIDFDKNILNYSVYGSWCELLMARLNKQNFERFG